MCLDRGIAKNYCPWGASFDLQVLQIPTYAQVGGVGLDIDRCIHIIWGYSYIAIAYAPSYISVYCLTQ